MAQASAQKITLIIGGGIAAYKSLDLVRYWMRQGIEVDCVMTQSARQFIQPLSFASLSRRKVRLGLFDESEEAEMDHIALSRASDLIVVAPATAHLIARIAFGLADDLATTLLLATDKRILLAPAMNWRMWEHAATQRNIAQLKQDGVYVMTPDKGEMACGEYGVGRLPEPERIAQQALALMAQTSSEPLLRGKKILITSGSTQEAIDPVRYIANRSSGKQGCAIASRLNALGAEVILISGKMEATPPAHIVCEHVESAQEMLAACEDRLAHEKIDVAICVAAVCDWRVAFSKQKIKKQAGSLPDLTWEENPDILAHIAHHTNRPDLVIGFAAETENVLAHARKKRLEKKCDWIIANNVANHVFGADHNQATLIRAEGETAWRKMTKIDLADQLAKQISDYFGNAVYESP